MIRFLLKIVVLPVLFILSILTLLYNIATNVYAHGAGVIINLFIVFGILALIFKQWSGALAMGIVIVGISILTVLLGFVGAFIEAACEAVKEFVFG